MDSTTPVTLRLAPGLRSRLEQLAAARSQPLCALVEQLLDVGAPGQRTEQRSKALHLRLSPRLQRLLGPAVSCPGQPGAHASLGGAAREILESLLGVQGERAAGGAELGLPPCRRPGCSGRSCARGHAPVTLCEHHLPGGGQ